MIRPEVILVQNSVQCVQMTWRLGADYKEKQQECPWLIHLSCVNTMASVAPQNLALQQAYPYFSILQIQLILSFLYSNAHLWKDPLN